MKLYLMVGNIGSGKSTEAKKLADDGAMIVNLDSILEMLHGKYGQYDYSRKGVYDAIEVHAITTALMDGYDVVVDRTNMDRKTRARFISLGKALCAEIQAIVMPDEPVDVLLARRMKEPRGLSRIQWGQIANRMKAKYEKPTREEGFDGIAFLTGEEL